MTNLKRDSFVPDSKIVPKINMYPINVPIHATANQYNPPVYTAQVYKSKQMEEKLVAVKASNFFDLKNDV